MTFCFRLLFALLLGFIAVVSAMAEGLPAASAHALAPLAPKGHFVTEVELRHNGYDHRFDADGRSMPLGAPFDGVAINAGIFPALAALGGGASLGTTALDTEVTLERLELTFGYGVTDHLTIGAIVNYGRTHNQVDFSLAGGNVGWNPLFNPALAIGLANYPFAPVGGGAPAPMDTAGLNQILSDPAFGYGYKPLGKSKTSGFGELIVGLLWRFYQSEQDSLVAGFGFRKGLGNGDDPDDLFDVPLDDGSDDVLLQLEYFRGWGNFDFRALVKHTIQTRDAMTMRVPAPGQLLSLSATRERLKRDLGDFWEYDLELGYSTGDWRFSATWHRWDKAADRYRSPTGQSTAALETDTDILADQWRLAVSWSGIRRWQEGKLPLPLIVKLELQETYAGRNMVDVRDIYLTASAFF